MNRIINLLSLVFILLFSARSTALEFEFGQFDVDKYENISDCIDNECIINFKNKGKYNGTPLVFIMPTFQDGNWRDAPSVLKLTEVTGEHAKFRQYIAPYNKSSLTLKELNQCEDNYCIEKVPMKKINYLVIDEGDIDLGSKGRIFAGSINANRYIQGGQKIKDSGKHQNVNQLAHTINYPQGFTSPGIITEIQADSTNKDWGHPNNWITPVAQKKNNKFYLSLDRSEVFVNKDYRSNLAYKGSRKIGYLIVEGSGVYRGLEFSLGQAETPNTLDNSIRRFQHITEPPRRQCEDTVNISESYRFSEFPFILASKNSRSGSDGGFFRLCKQVNDGSTKKVSFVNDEDLNEPRKGKSWEACGGQACLERKHANEQFGFIAFQQKVDAAVCDMFPGPAQTWFGNDVHGIQLYLATYGNDTTRYPQILNAVKKNGKRNVGFIPGKVRDDGKAGCNGIECKGDTHLRIAEQPALPDFPEPDDVRPIPDIIDDTIENLSSSANIGALTIQNGGQLTLHTGTYFIDSINLNNGGKIIVPAGNKVKIHTKWLSMSQVGSEIKASQNTEDLVIYIHADLSDKPHGVHDYIALDQYSKIRGLVYSEKVIEMSNGSEITGAVTAIKLNMHNQAKITGESICIETQPEFTVTLSPPEAQPLLCKAQKVDFQFTSADGGSGRYTGAMHIQLSGEGNKSVKGQWAQQQDGPWESFQGNNSSFSVSVSGEEASLWFKSDKLGRLNIEATIDNMAGDTALGHYNFIPGGLEIIPNAVNLVAGKPSSLTMKVLACDDGENSEALQDYHGDKIFDFKSVNIQPSVGNASQYKIELKDTGQSVASLKWQDKQGTFYFNKGIAADIPVRYMDAGQLKLDVECFGSSCGVDETGKKNKKTSQTEAVLKAETTIKSRPYTFALCDSGTPKVESATGTANEGERFLAAGDMFGVIARPVIWIKDDQKKKDIGNSQQALKAVDSSAMCGRQITVNYYQDTAPESTVLLNHELVSPNLQEGGEKGSLAGMLSQRNTLLMTVPFKASWSEVGSLRLQADTTEKYLGMDVNRGYRSVGRFYPKYLKLIADSFSYPLGQTGFAYMDQGFMFGFTVEAQNTDQQPTKNYGLFADDLKASLELMVVDSTKAETVVNTQANRVEYFSRKGTPYTWAWSGEAWNKGGDNQSDTARMNITDSNFTFVRHYDNNTNRNDEPRYSSEDGPFDSGNTRMGLFIKTKPDPLDWDYTRYDGEDKLKQVEIGDILIGQVWRSKPDIRYGRMMMEDAVGRTDSNIAIPLRVEYWNGSAFITNDDDSLSKYDGQYSCKQIIANSADKLKPGESSNSYTQGGGIVEKGGTQSGQFIAVPHKRGVSSVEGYREQVRFWQKLVNVIPRKVDTNDQTTSCKSGYVGSSPQSWLLYNWRGLGDENPSAVVTFGVYRGNDRIIYRGEKGMNQLLN